MDIQFEEDTNFAAVLTQLKQHILQGHACVCPQHLCMCQCDSPLNYAKVLKALNMSGSGRMGEVLVVCAPSWYHL